MKQEEQRYEEWLEKVRRNLPTVENPEELSNDIMQRISRTPHPPIRTVNWVRWLSAVAALFLLCTMLYEVLFYAEVPPLEKETVTINSCPSTEIIPTIPLEQMSEMTMQEKTAFLSRIRKERKEIKCKRKKLLNKLIDRNH